MLNDKLERTINAEMDSLDELSAQIFTQMNDLLAKIGYIQYLYYLRYDFLPKKENK